MPRAESVNLYLGLSVLLPAAAGAVLVARRRGGDEAGDVRLAECRAAAVLSGMVISVCFAFSLPPTDTRHERHDEPLAPARSAGTVCASGLPRLHVPGRPAVVTAGPATAPH